jgi:hypothetical protein
MSREEARQRTSVVTELTLFVVTIVLIIILVLNEFFGATIAPEVMILIGGVMLLILYFAWARFYAPLVGGAILTSIGFTIVLAPIMGPPLQTLARNLGGEPQWAAEFWPIHFIGLGLALLLIWGVVNRDREKILDKDELYRWPKLVAWLLLFGGLMFTIEAALMPRTRNLIDLLITIVLLLYRGIQRLRETRSRWAEHS